MKIPNLFIPGAAKSGTSSLHDYLNQHPDIFMAKKKEPHYFTYKGKNSFSLERYLELFEGGEFCKYRGESSTGYMVFPEFIENIKNFSPQAKFIFVLRNPIDRIYSHYWWLKGQGDEEEDLFNAIEKEINHEPDPKRHLIGGNYKFYFQFGLYGKWIEVFFKHVSKKNIFIVTSEVLKKDPLGTLNFCFEFLGLPIVKKIEQLNSNKTMLLRNPIFYGWVKKKMSSESIVKKMVHLVLPPKFSTKVKTDILSLVSNFNKSPNTYPKLTKGERLILRNLYANDVSKLKKITGHSFPEWTDFKI